MIVLFDEFLKKRTVTYGLKVVKTFVKTFE